MEKKTNKINIMFYWWVLPVVWFILVYIISIYFTKIQHEKIPKNNRGEQINREESKIRITSSINKMKNTNFIVVFISWT